MIAPRLATGGLAIALAAGLSLPATLPEPTEPEVRGYFAPEPCIPGSSDTYQRGDVDLTGQEATSLLGVRAIQGTATGAGTRVAVLSTGVEPGNPAIQGAAVEPGVNLTEGSSALADPYGMGTALTSIIVGQNRRDARVTGLAPRATVVPVRVFLQPPDDLASPGYPIADVVAEGVNQAIDQDADVVLVGVALPFGSPALEQAVARAESEGVVVVAPAGDVLEDDDVESTDNPRYPAAYPTVLSVGAVNSNAGSSSNTLRAESVNVAAPGQNVVVANGARGTCIASTGQTNTTYSAAFVAGAAATLLSQFPDETPEQIRFRLEVTGVRVTDTQSSAVGWGMIDLPNALAFIDDGTANGPDSPNTTPPEPTPVAGQDVPEAEPDPLRMTKPLSIAAGAITALGGLGLLVIALRRRT